MLDLSTIEVDPKLAQEGVWAEYMGGRFLIARQGAAHQAELGRLYTENMDLIKSETPEGHLKVLEIYQRAFCKTVLIGWEGITNKGEPLPYDFDTAFKILSDPRQVELSQWLERFSLNHSNYREAVEADIADDVKSSAVS